MKTFTVWFRVGRDFKETIEAEDVHDANDKWTARFQETTSSYLKQIEDDWEAVIYDIAEAGEDLDTYRAVERFEEVIDE